MTKWHDDRFPGARLLRVHAHREKIERTKKAAYERALGNPLNAGTLEIYTAGTSAPKATYREAETARGGSMTFDDLWKTLPIPGEFDSMDKTDQGRWRGVIELAYNAGLRERVSGGPAEVDE